MQVTVSSFFPFLYMVSAVRSAFIGYSSSSYVDFSDYQKSHDVGSGDGSNPLADLDGEEEVFTTEIVDLSTIQATVTPKPSTTPEAPQARVRIPQTCCELGAIAARQGYSCRPESHREKLRAQSYRSGNLGNHLFKTKNASQAAREDHKRVEAQLRNFSKCVTGISRRMEEDFIVCCKRTSIELFDDGPIRKPSSPRDGYPYLGYYNR